MKSLPAKLIWFLYAGIALYAFYCYNPFVLYFQNDDFIHIPLSAKGIIFQRNSFRPICDLSIILDQYIWGKNAVGYHITNLLLHLISCFLVFTCTKKILRKYFADQPVMETAFIVALLFFVYATHSEAVLWILGRSAILGLIFSLLFLLQYAKRKQELSSVVAYILLLFAALLTYESSFILPAVCIVLFFIDRNRNDVFHLSIVWSVFIIYLFARWYVTGEILGTYEVANVHQSGIISIFSSIISIFSNLTKLVIRCFIPAYSQGIYILIPFIIIAVSFAVLLFKRRNAKSLVLAALFLLSLIPYVMLGIDAHGYEGERYLYFPLFILCLLMVLTLQQAFIGNTIPHLFILLILIMHSISLSISASNFEFAGSINKMIIQSVDKLVTNDTLYIHNLPQAQNGALIMRDGFPEAVNWLDTNKNKPVFIIKSKRSEWLPLNTGYQSAYNESVPVNEISQNRTERSAVFYFSDSVLFIRQ